MVQCSKLVYTTQFFRDEREMALTMRKVWRLIAQDLNLQKNDPLLFPATASEELLRKMPPTVIWEVEFDMFFTGSQIILKKISQSDVADAPCLKH